MIKQFDSSFFNCNLTEDQKLFIKKIERFESFFKEKTSKFSSIFCVLSDIKIDNKHEKNSGLEHITKTVSCDFNKFKINKPTILSLHETLYQDDHKLENDFRNRQNYIYTTKKDNTKKLAFKPISPSEIDNAMTQLCEALNEEWNKPGTNKLCLISMFFADFLMIHPFIDGNGRTGRLLVAILFLQAGFSVFKYVSLENIIHKRRGLYYQSLHKSQAGWYENKNDYWPFVLNMLLTLQDAYKELDRKFIIEGYKQNHNPQWLETALLYSIIPYRVNDIASALPDFSTDLIQQTIDKLVSEGKLAKLSPGNIYKSLIWDKK